MDYARYQRHFSVIGIDGQSKLKASSVLIVGCGGIGSPVSLYLAAAGIGKIGVVDFDKVSLSNLQRQIVFSEKDVGKRKTTITYDRLSELNKDILVIEHPFKLDDNNARAIFREYDLIIDGSDNFSTRYLINDICCQEYKPFISASVLIDSAQLMYFDISKGCYRCLYPEPPPSELSPSCAQAGVIGAVVGVVGTMAANMAVNLLCREQQYTSQIRIYNGLTLTWEILQYSKNEKCLGCVQKKQQLVLPDPVLWDVPIFDDFDSINTYRLIDVREAWEHEIQYIYQTDMQVSSTDILMGDYLELKIDKPTIFYCKQGGRSAKVVNFLIKKGVSDIYSLNGGIKEYLKRNNQQLCY